MPRGQSIPLVQRDPDESLTVERACRSGAGFGSDVMKVAAKQRSTGIPRCCSMRWQFSCRKTIRRFTPATRPDFVSDTYCQFIAYTPEAKPLFEKAGIGFSDVHGELRPEMARNLPGEGLAFRAAGVSLIFHPCPWLPPYQGG